jgi:HAD superfamily hydrolase (TIGR01509 family)
MVAAVIFDHDGLTLDTESVWTRAETALFARHGATFGADHKRDLLGNSRAAAAAKLERHLALPAGGGDAVMDELHALVMDELRGGTEAMPGATALLGALRAAGVPVGLASNSTADFVALALAGAGLGDAFDAIVTADQVERPKPAPDVYLAAAAALGAEPADSVALEDSPTGVAAARAAGMTVVGIPSFPGIALDGADLVAPSLEHPDVWELLGLTAGGRAVL